jgi:hypothetical protein
MGALVPALIAEAGSAVLLRLRVNLRLHYRQARTTLVARALQSAVRESMPVMSQCDRMDL